MRGLLLGVDKDEHQSEATSMPEKIGKAPNEDLREALLNKPSQSANKQLSCWAGAKPLSFQALSEYRIVGEVSES